MGAGMSRVWCKSIQRMAFQPPQVDFSIHYNTCFVRAIDGNNIAVRVVEPDEGTDKTDMTVLFSHGNAEDVKACSPFAVSLANTLRATVVTYDYVGYGFSSAGVTSEQNMYSAIEAVYAYLIDVRSIEPSKILVAGRSMGCAPTLHLATTGMAKDALCGVLLMSGFASGVRVLHDWSYFDGRVLRAMDELFCANLHKIQQVQRPVMIVHGDKDTVISVKHAHLLANACACDCLYKCLIVSGGHNDIYPEQRQVCDSMRAFQTWCVHMSSPGIQPHITHYEGEGA